MANYKHGAYGQIQAVGSRVSEDSQSAFVYIGTAPVHTVEGGAANVNKPILVSNIAEARKYFGYSENFADFTLCEVMNAHFNLNGVGPLIFINVFDPATHKETAGGTKSLTPKNGRVTIADAGLVVLDSVVVKSGSTTKVKGTDYSIAYNIDKQQIVIAELSAGALGTTALTITYDIAKPGAVTASDVIGSSDGYGLNTGIFAVKNVYNMTGHIPSFMLAPGFSGVPSVHSAMVQNSRKINDHWDAYILADIPIVDDDTAITLENVATWKEANGYNSENETVYFPMVTGTDGKKYHLSTLAAANLQSLMSDQDGIPYHSASNTAAAIIENLYMGEDNAGRVYDDAIINSTLNKNGIASAAFVGGRWAIWGAHSADYNPDNMDSVNVAETNRMMLYYISNDFQARRMADVDRPMTINDILAIVSDEQARLDALRNIGALIYGEVHHNAELDDMSDLVHGDFSFTFNVTTTPLAKSLTAIVNWTDEGFVTYFASFEDQE